MWKVYSAFTSETASRLFKALHMGQIYSCVSTLNNLLQKYVNPNIVNIINSSYIKADNSTIFNWLQNNMEFVSKIVATYTNLERETLWIPKTAFPATLHGLGKLIVEDYNPTGWRFQIHFYNTIYFGERIKALRYVIYLFRESTIEEELHLNKFQPSQPTLGTCY